MADSKVEKRKNKRYDVDSVHGKMTYSSDINILNVSLDGAAIATTQRLKIDRIYSIRLKFEDNSVTLKGKVVWSVLSHSKTLKNGEVVPVYKAGIRFADVLNDAAMQLISYIEKSRLDPLEKRILGVRFKVTQHEGAAIDLPFEYRIKKISLAGMLIETDSVLELDTQHEMEIALNGSTLTVTGRIANLQETRTGDLVKYAVGIEFVELSDESLKILQSYIAAMEKGS